MSTCNGQALRCLASKQQEEQQQEEQQQEQQQEQQREQQQEQQQEQQKEVARRVSSSFRVSSLWLVPRTLFRLRPCLRPSRWR